MGLLHLPRLAWAAWALALVLAALGLALLGLNRSEPSGPVFDYWLENAAQALAFPTVGALIASARPRNPIGWILVVAGLSGAVVLFCAEYALYALFTSPGSLPGGHVAAWLSAWVGTLAFGAVFSFLFLLFPDGRLLSARWRPVAWLSGVLLTVVALSGALKPVLTDEGGAPVPNGAPRPIRNPFGIDGAESVLHSVETTSIVLFVALGAIPAVVSLVLRYRRSTGELRLQIKWLAYAAGILALGIFVVPDLLMAAWGETDAVTTVNDALEVAPVFGIPLAVGVAVLRHRLYDVDLVISRTLVYGALTATLVFRLVLGQLIGESDLAVAGSTLVVAALFRPLRRRIQSVVDRRFYRSRFDAARTLERFSTRLRDELDIETLGADLRHVVRDTMAPSHVSLWLRSAP
jgi:hypothetical protein